MKRTDRQHHHQQQKHQQHHTQHSRSRSQSHVYNAVETTTGDDGGGDPSVPSVDQSVPNANANGGANPTCRYQERDGQCLAACDAANSATDATKIQTPCADSSLTCCMTEPTATWCSRGHQPGVCMSAADCTTANTDATPHHTSSGLCHGANSALICCLAGVDKTPNFDTSTMNTLIHTDTSSVNTGLKSATIAFQKKALGDPGVQCSSDACLGCCPSQSPITTANLVMMDVGPFNLNVFKPFGDTLKLVFEDVLAARPELFWYLKTAGSFCCRPVKHNGHALVGSFSNHAWGAAVDLYYGPTIDAQGDSMSQQALFDLVPFFNTRKLFWGGGFGLEDSMHFEASQDLVVDWGCSGAYTRSNADTAANTVGGVSCDTRTAAADDAPSDLDQVAINQVDEGANNLTPDGTTDQDDGTTAVV